MSERAMRSRVVKWLKPWDAVAVENPAHPGTPDVNYADGWIELKKIASWPKRETTTVQLPHFTPQQRIWLSRRARAGGTVWVLLQVGQEWLLFDGVVAAKVLGDSTQAELVSASLHVWAGGAEAERGLKCLLQKN